jgi:GNAT superfamily N-acetyltransferase
VSSKDAGTTAAGDAGDARARVEAISEQTAEAGATGGLRVHVRAALERDVPTLLELFAELAEYEHLTHELRASEQGLASALFGPAPAARALIAERDGRALGYALYFRTFSSFLTSTGIWLEDLFVRPDSRGEGIGQALLAAVAAEVVDEGGERMEWAALDWNEPALGFYRRLGARTMGEWITHRMDGDALARLARVSRPDTGEEGA